MDFLNDAEFTVNAQGMPWVTNPFMTSSLNVNEGLAIFLNAREGIDPRRAASRHARLAGFNSMLMMGDCFFVEWGTITECAGYQRHSGGS